MNLHPAKNAEQNEKVRLNVHFLYNNLYHVNLLYE